MGTGKYGIGARVRDEDGDVGTIVGKRKGERLVRYGADLLGVEIWVPKRCLTVLGDNDNAETVAPEQGRFKVGDRVKVICGGEPCAGMTGRIYAADRKGCDLDVQIDGWGGGHSGDAKDGSENHWYLCNGDVELVADAPDWQPKVGDRVRFTDECNESWWFGPRKKYKDGTVSKTDGGGTLSIHVKCSNGDTAFVNADQIEPLPVAAEAQGAGDTRENAGGGFKAGDRIRLVKSPLEDMPLGSEFMAVARTSGNAGSVHFKDGNGDYVTWRPGSYFELVQPLTIEAGKYYRTRDGRKVGPMEVYDGRGVASDKDGRVAAFYAKHFGSYTSDGAWLCGSSMCQNNLVAEWADEVAAQTADAPVAVAPATATPAAPKFKVGDRVRRVSNPYDFVPIGYEAVVLEVRDDRVWYRDNDGDRMASHAEVWVLAEPADTPVSADATATPITKGNLVTLARPAMVTGFDPNNPAYAHVVLGTGGTYTLPVAALVAAE